MNTTPPYSICICPYSNQSLVYEQPAWKLVTSHVYKINGVHHLLLLTLYIWSSYLKPQSSKSSNTHPIQWLSVPIPLSCSCFSQRWPGHPNELSLCVLQLKNKLQEVVKGTHKYPLNMAVVAFNNVIVVMLEGVHEHVGIVGEHNPQIVQVILVMCL